MDIRPIRTETDYREALSKVDSLWAGATPGRQEDDRLDILVTQTHVSEREHHPIPSPDPIEVIKCRAEHLGIGPNGLEGIASENHSCAAVDQLGGAAQKAPATPAINLKKREQRRESRKCWRLERFSQ